MISNMKVFEITWNSESFILIAESEPKAKQRAAGYLKLMGLDVTPNDLVIKELCDSLEAA